MSGSNSPMKFSGVPDYEEAGFDPHFTAEISNKMRVPKNIRISGGGEDRGSESDEMNSNWSRSNGYIPYPEKFDMQVPDRIIVRGQDQHVGTKALPRELQLDAASPMQLDPEMIRILTPPRTITLHQPPQEYQNHLSQKLENEDETMVIRNNTARFLTSNMNGNILDSTISLGLGNREAGLEASGFYDAEVQAELDHFRDQFKRLANRVTVCEADIKERMEREKYILYVGGFYLALQVFRWLFRSNQH